MIKYRLVLQSHVSFVKVRQPKMSERFDILFEGMSEEQAISFLETDNGKLQNPGVKYLAASRLGAAISINSLKILKEIATRETDNLFDKIARRKVIEALGRRKDEDSVPVLLRCLKSEDEPSVINAADSLGRIGKKLNDREQVILAEGLNGSDNQKRAIIQTFCRLGLEGIAKQAEIMETDENPMVAGAAIAYRNKINGHNKKMAILINQLADKNAGRRRAAVIDLGDSGYAECLEYLSKAPVSMPLRIKSILQVCTFNNMNTMGTKEAVYIENTLRDNPTELNLLEEWLAAVNEENIISQLKHRDEGRQYAAACFYLKMSTEKKRDVISSLIKEHSSDYGVHYFIVMFIGLLGLEERRELVKQALGDDSPQYTKSRIAAAWSTVALNLVDQQEVLERIEKTSLWLPLQWTCQSAIKQLKQINL